MFLSKLLSLSVLVLVCGMVASRKAEKTCIDRAELHQGLLGGWQLVDQNQMDGWDNIATSLFDELNSNSDSSDSSTYQPSASNDGNQFHAVYKQVVSRAYNLCIEFEALECQNALCGAPQTFVAEVRQTFGPLLYGGEPTVNVKVMDITAVPDEKHENVH